MRKASAAIIFAAAMAATAQAIDGTAATGYGYYNNATNSNYTTTVGYGAGWGAAYDIRSCLFGAVAGRNSGDLLRCQAFGYGAMDGASNCTDCVAIGYKAGAGWRNRTGWVQIGGAIAVTNGIADIKAPNGASIGPLRLGADAYDQDHDLKGNLSVQSEYNTTTGTRTGGRIYAGDWIEAPQGYFAQAQIGEISFISSAVTIGTDANRLCVYTNGVLAGYLTITPPAAAQQ